MEPLPLIYTNLLPMSSLPNSSPLLSFFLVFYPVSFEEANWIFKGKLRLHLLYTEHSTPPQQDWFPCDSLSGKTDFVHCNLSSSFLPRILAPTLPLPSSFRPLFMYQAIFVSSVFHCIYLDLCVQ